MENTAIVENPYGLSALWAQGDWVSKGTLLVLALMSLGSWYIMLTKLWDQGKLTDHIDLHEWITMSLTRAVDAVNGKLQSGLWFLATTGSAAPFVGLFGTVWGIYHALIAISIAGQASIDKVAGPVGEALIMTAIGLAVAVPAVLGYNLLLRRNKAILDQFRYFTNDLYATLVSSSQK